eukprot:m.43756 g.43756  ORF g.43756 m.43756 type:complete len:377 (-) comp10005_c0_seq1:47-1177(-)
MQLFFLVVTLSALSTIQTVQSAACSCSSEKLCRPQYRPPNDYARDKEIFGFANGRSYTNWDWSVVSTVAWATEPELICEAHKHGARVVMASPAIDLANLTTEAEIKVWVKNTVEKVVDGGFDGITFDYESPISRVERQAAETYVRLINATRAALRIAVPNSQTSVCVAWSPDNIDGRDYDAKGLSEAADLLYVMNYDTRSQIFDRCLASANAALSNTMRGINRWLDLGISPQKLILGLPWYGYIYPCDEGEMESPSSKYCPIASVPFRGVNCSDAAGHEMALSGILDMLHSKDTIGGSRWDNSTMSPYFNYRSSSGSVQQIWYDDSRSLRLKYDFAKEMGLRGTGPFTFDDLNYNISYQAEEAKKMWEAIRSFSEP